MMSNEVSFCNSILKAVNVLKKVTISRHQVHKWSICHGQGNVKGKKSRLEQKLGNPGGNPGL